MSFFNTSLKNIYRKTVLLIVITLLLLNIGLLTFEKSVREQEVKDNLENVVNLQAVFIEKWLSERVLNIQTLSKLPVVKAQDFDRMLEVFRGFVEDSEFAAIVYVDKYGTAQLDSNTNERIQFDLSDREYFIEGKKGNQHITDVIIGRNTGQPVIFFSAPIYDDSGLFQGVLFGPVLLSTIEKVMNQYQFGETGGSYIVDKSSNLITLPRSFNGVDKTQLSEESLETLRTNIERALSGFSFDTYYNNYKNTKVMGVYQKVNNGNWIIFAEINRSEVLKSFYWAATSMLAVSLIVLFLSYRLMSLIHRNVYRPIQHVLDGAKQMIEGNYQEGRAPSFENTPTELKELHEVYNEMTATISSDIARRKESQKILFEAQKRFSAIFENAGIGILLMDLDGRIIECNPAIAKLLKYQPYELFGKQMDELTHRDDLKNSKDSIKRLIAKEIESFRLEKRWYRKDGQIMWGRINGSSVENIDGEIEYLIFVVEDITERVTIDEHLTHAYKKLKDLSNKDGLTGIFNRRYFDKALEMEWNRHKRNGKELSIVFFDIDFFKIFNDTYGHIEGDECLKTIAKKAEKILKRSGDLLARYGGEEFVMVLPETDLEGARQMAEQLRETIYKLKIPNEKVEGTNVVTISAGVSTIVPSDILTSKDLVDQADQALYKAKSNGRNRVEVFLAD